MARQRKTLARRHVAQDDDSKESDPSYDDAQNAQKVRKKENIEIVAPQKSFDQLYRIIQAAINYESDKKNLGEARKFWKAAIHRIKKLKKSDRMDQSQLQKETDYKDEVFRTPLRMAAEGNAPFEVVQALVQANPNLCEQQCPVDSAYPLHVACGTSKMEEREREQTIRLLMKTSPQAILKKHDDGNATALHLLLEHNPSLSLVQDMVQEAPSILQEKDKEDHLPIHVAIEHENSDPVVTFIAESFPDGLNETVGDDDLSCLHLAILYKRYNVIEKIAELCPEKIQKKLKKRGNLPLHMLLDEETKLPKEQLQNICCRLLSIYKKHFGPEVNIKMKMTNLLKRIRNKHNDSILRVAEKASKKNHPSITSDLVQILNDVSDGKFDSLTIIPETIVKTEDNDEISKGKDQQEQRSPSSRTSSQRTWKVTNKRSIDNPNKVSQEILRKNPTYTQSEEENIVHSKSFAENDKERQTMRTTAPLATSLDSSNHKNDQTTFESPKRVATTKPVCSPFFDNKEPSFDDISLSSDDVPSDFFASDDPANISLDQPGTGVDNEAPPEPNRPTEVLPTTAIVDQNPTLAFNNHSMDTNELGLHRPREEVNINPKNVESPQLDHNNVTKNHDIEQNESNRLKENVAASYNHSKNNSMEVSDSRGTGNNEVMCLQTVDDEDGSNKSGNSFSISRIEDSDVSIPTSFVQDTNSFSNTFQDKTSSPNATDVSTVSGNSQETGKVSENNGHIEKENSFAFPNTCGKRKRRPLENCTNELIIL